MIAASLMTGWICLSVQEGSVHHSCPKCLPQKKTTQVIVITMNHTHELYIRNGISYLGNYLVLII